MPLTNFVGCIERHLDLAGIGIDDEGLMLGERGWSEYASEGEDCEGISLHLSWGVDYWELPGRRVAAIGIVGFSWRLHAEQQRRAGRRVSALPSRASRRARP